MAKNNNPRSRLPYLVAAACASSLSLSVAIADDTEVFFGQSSGNANTNPNILFVLDTSGSMGYKDGTELTRLERMKDALEEILNNTTNVNVGLMNFNGTNGGGAVLYPITPIDQPVCEQGSCDEQSAAPRISRNDDDIEERISDGDMSLNGNILSLGVSGRGSELVGMRYTDINIPQGAEITSAWVEFRAHSYRNEASELTIEAELAASSDPFSNTDNDASSRTTTTTNPVEWTPGTWYTGVAYDSPDVSDLLQEVVDQADWCGGNSLAMLIKGTGERAAVSFNQSPTNAPQLFYTFDTDNIADGEGCVNKTAVSSIALGSDDAEERVSNGNTDTDSSDMELAYDGDRKQIVGLRFTDVQIPKNAVITGASIEFEVDEQHGDSVSVKIEGQAADNPPTFESDRYNISSRPTTSAVNWTNIPSPPVSSKLITPDIAAITQQLVDRNGWQSGNSMVYMLSHIAGDYRDRRTLESWEGERQNAAKLFISYRATSSDEEPIIITARDELKEVVNGLKESGGTPIVDAYYEAARYFRGDSVDYGTQRGQYANNRYYRVSTPDSYTGGNLDRDNACSDADLSNSNCSDEKITGNPVYVSPIKSECQSNHIVILSDGEATSNSAKEKVRTMTGDSSCAWTSDSDDRCGTELASYISTTDQRNTLINDQLIKTFTIGFNFDSGLLSSIASAAGGEYFTADSSSDLVAVFQSILGDVSSVDTSFVAPGATVNQFNRLTHRNDIYFALFKPSNRPVWSGNIKRYQMGVNGEGEVSINDATGIPAVDPATGFFHEGSRSAWLNALDADDGNDVAMGGAAMQLVFDDAPRRVFTYTGDNASIPASGIDLKLPSQALSEINTSITTDLLGITNNVDTAANIAAYRTDLLKWARGIDVKDVDEDGETTDWRQHMGDPMHARPVILNYATGGGTKTAVFVGTNEGYLHAFDSENGDELFSYVPKELLQNLGTFWNNQSSDSHPYGLDGTLSVWTTDLNENVTIDAGEKAYLYTGMRRGGSNYYALNVATHKDPRLAWVIEGGTTGFEELGQTWSKMTPTKIRFNGTERDVLVFGAGYDENQDASFDADGNHIPRSNAGKGRGLYIVDAETGTRLFAALGSATGDLDLQAKGMNYSMPGDLRVLDSDYDGFADQIYASDTGGQIWRFDITQYHEAGQPLLKGGVMAKLSDTSGMPGERRFYHEPDVAIISDNGDRFVAISIGSGWRAHPLDTDVEDRFYMIKSPNLFEAPKGYGKSDDGVTFTPITEADLVDITNDINPTMNSFGWLYDLPANGEKVLGSSVTANNQVIFTTYNPEVAVTDCSPAVGSGSVYALNILNGAPAVDINDDGEIDIDDRSKALAHGGIPPEAAVLITDNGPTLLAGPEQPIKPKFDDLTRRTFWVDNDNE